MPIRTQRTEQGGISASQTPAGADISAAEIAVIQDPVNQSVAFRDNGATGKHVDVAVRGNYAFAITENSDTGNTDTLTVIDASDPLNPEIVNQVVRDGSTLFTTLDFLGQYLVLGEDASGEGGISIWDISDPENINEDDDLVGSNVPGGEPVTQGVFVKGDYAYAVGGNKLTVYDVSDQTAPTVAGSDELPDSDENFVIRVNVKVVDEFVYATGGNPEVAGAGGFLGKIWDVSDPTTPVASSGIGGINVGVSQFDPIEVVQTTDVAVRGDFTFGSGADTFGLGDVPGAFGVVDSSDFSQQEQIARIDLNDPLGALELDGDTAIGFGKEYVHTFDVSKPAHPVKTGEVSVSGISTRASGQRGNLNVAVGNGNDNGYTVLI